MIDEELIYAYALENAIKHKGKANCKSVMKSLIGHHKALKTCDGDKIANSLIMELKNDIQT